MQSIHFNHLHANLIEIYTALHAQHGADDLPLYATFSSHIYFQGSITSRIVKIWNNFCREIHPSVENVLKLTLTTFFDHAAHCAYDVRQRRIWNNMRQIDQVWKTTLQPQDFIKQRDRYAHYLSEELKGSVEANSLLYLYNFDKRAQQPLSLQEAKALRHTIVNFHQATYVFWSFFIKNKTKNDVICQPLIHLMEPSSILMDRILFKILKKEGRWVQMEGVMRQSIPVDLFAKLGDPQSLSVNEKRRLKLWTQALNDCQDAISPRLFSCVLNEIMNVIYLQGSSPLTLPDLLTWLDQQGCQIIHQGDPAHKVWREKLSPGDTIECNGKQLILGQQLSPDKLIDDTFKIFELENYPDYVVKIAHNRLLLLIEDKKASNEQEHWGVRLVETIANIEEDEDSIVRGLDRQGRCMVLEKLSSSFDSQVWTSQELELTKEDEKSALVFANHLFCMSQWKATAQNLSLAHLMWDKKGRLKSTRLLKKGPANYNNWEAYCESAAKENFYVLSFLMHVSKLSEHEIALYYRKAVEYTLKTGKTDLVGRPLPLGHRQDTYTQHIRQLCAQAQELRQKCFESVMALLCRKKQYSYHQEKQLKKEVADKLIEFYQASPTPGRFSPHLAQQVIDSLTKTNAEITSLPDPSLVQDYYQEKYELMMEYNQACLSEENLMINKE